jgi:hypothetical protein
MHNALRRRGAHARRSVGSRACGRIELLEQRRLLAAIFSDQTQNGTISALGEVDEFTFAANAGDSIVAFVAETTMDAAYDPRVELVAPGGATVVFGRGEVGADIFANNLASSGTYTLRVSDDGNNDTGDYAITLAHVPNIQVPNDGNGGALSSGPRVNAAITAGDLDVYTIAANAGDAIHLSAVRTLGLTTFHPHLRVYSPTGTLTIEAVGEVGADTVFTAASSGTYYVVFKDWTTTNVSGFDVDIDTGSYALTMARLPGAQSDDGSDGGTITSGLRRSGAIALGDLDVYTFSANAGDNIIVSIASLTSELSPQMYVYQPDGALLATVQGDQGAFAALAAVQSGTYFVVVKDWTTTNVNNFDVGFGFGDYQLFLAKLPGVQTTDTDNEGGALASGPRRTGRIDLGDLDVFTIAANTSDTVILSVADTDGGNFQPELRVFNPSGAAVTSAVGTVGADLSFTATQTGTYYLVVRDWTTTNVNNSQIDLDAGAYAIYMAKVPGAQTDDGTDGGPLTSGLRTTGTLGVADLDVFTIDLAAGDSLIGVARSFENAVSEAQVLLYSPSGALLDSSNGTNNGLVSVNSVATPGTYYVVVKDVTTTNVNGFDIDVEAGEYALTFVRTPGAQTVDPDSGALTSGQARAGSVSFGDLDVYTFPVTAGNGFALNLAETATFGFDPTFTLYNPSGTVVTTQTGATNASVVVSNANALTGTYTVVVYDAAGDESGPYSIGLNTAAGADNFAPRVLDAQYRYDTAPPDLRVIFSESVGASFASTDVEIIDLATNQPVDNALLAFVYDAAIDGFKVTFPALPGRVLPDGNYRLRVAAANLTDAAGNPLDQDLSHDFFVLAGDANRDRVVNLRDFNALASNFGKSGRLFSQGDFNYDGQVTLADFNILANRFGQGVAPAGSSSFARGLENRSDDIDDPLSNALA